MRECMERRKASVVLGKTLPLDDQLVSISEFRKSYDDVKKKLAEMDMVFVLNNNKQEGVYLSTGKYNELVQIEAEYDSLLNLVETLEEQVEYYKGIQGKSHSLEEAEEMVGFKLMND